MGGLEGTGGWRSREEVRCARGRGPFCRGAGALQRRAELSALLNTGRSPPSVHAHGRLHVEARRARREDGRDCAA